MRKIAVQWIGILLCAGVAVSGEITEQLLAVVNGQIIFLSDIQRDAVFFSDQPLSSFQDQVNQRINHVLLLDEAKRFVSEPPSSGQIAQALQKVQSKFSSPAIFLEHLSQMGMRLETLQASIADRLWIEALIRDRIRFFIFVSDEEIKQYIRDHPDLEGEMEQRTLSIRTFLEKEKEQAKLKEYIEQLRLRATIEMG